MSKSHAFRIDFAELYGVHEAILITNFEFWIGHNHANGSHEHDGRTWTYNSVKAFEALFPYLTYKQIRTSIDHLVMRDVLLRGNYNTHPSDRTSWFAFSDSYLAQNPLPHGAIGVPKKANPLPHRAIGDAPQGKSLIGTDITQDVNILPAAPTAPLAAEVPADKPKKPEKPVKVEAPEELALQAASRATWSAYALAYRVRYGAEPVRNAKVSSAVKAFVGRLSHDEAPLVAEFFVGRVNEQGVTRATHDFGLLLARAESYRTQWATGRTADESAPNSETAYQRSMRERVAEVSPLLARPAPGAQPAQDATAYFQTIPAIEVTK